MSDLIKLSRSQRAFLELGLRNEQGNPWREVGMRARGGGSKSRMAEELKQRGYLDEGNCLTELAREYLRTQSPGERQC